MPFDLLSNADSTVGALGLGQLGDPNNVAAMLKQQLAEQAKRKEKDKTSPFTAEVASPALNALFMKGATNGGL